MRLRTRLVTAAVLASAVAVLVLAGLALVTGRTQAALDEQAEAEEVARGVANMLSLTNEFTLYEGERAATQWRARHAQLRGHVERALQRRQPPSQQLLELRHNIDDLPTLFETLVQVSQAPATPLTSRRRELLLERLLIETQEVVESRYRWGKAIATAQQSDQHLYTGMVLAAPAVLLLLLLTLATLVGRRVLDPLARMEAAVHRMRAGDHAARCAVDTDDEVGDASRAVDAMAQALQQQTVALRESERRLRLITDSLPALIGHVDSGERYTFVNAQFERLGFGEAAVTIGRTVREALGEEVYRVAAAYIGRALAGETVSFETTHTENHQAIHRQSTYVADIDAAGTVRGFFTMTFDITARKEAELRLSASERLLIDITDNLPALVSYVDRDHIYRFANSKYGEWLGIDASAMIGCHVREALGPEAYELGRPYLDAALSGRRTRWERPSALGPGKFTLLTEYIPAYAPDGSVRGCYALTIDITERRQGELAVARAERQLRAIADNLPVLISYIDSAERYTFANATFREWLAIDPASVVGRQVVDVPETGPYEQRREPLRRALGGERVAFELETTALGVTRSLQNSYIPDIQPDGSVAGVYTLSTDVTAMRQVERQLSRLAHADELTGLPNRRQFDERMMRALHRASRSRQPVALMFLDVDHFKSINDQLGHAAGDAVLRELGVRLKAAVRVTDTAARLAGDEFVVLLESLTGVHDAEVVAEKISSSIRRPFRIDDSGLSVTVSVGVAYCARPAPDSPMMACADEALYAAKAAGRNTFKVGIVDTFETVLGDLDATASSDATGTHRRY